MAETKTSFKNLWPLISGIILVLLGIFVLFNPTSTLVALALYIGIIFVVVGFSYIMAFLSWKQGGHLAIGLLDILVGIILLSNLSITAASLPIIFALWAMFVGIIHITEAVQLHKIDFPWQVSAAAGVVSLCFGVLFLVFPLLGAVAITFIIGSYIILYGFLEIWEYNLLKAKH